MTCIGVLVTRPDNTARTYTAGRSIETDGYGDYVIRDEAGGIIATRKRATVEEIELIYE